MTLRTKKYIIMNKTPFNVSLILFWIKIALFLDKSKSKSKINKCHATLMVPTCLRLIWVISHIINILGELDVYFLTK